MNSFLVGTPEGARLCTSFQDCSRYRGKTSKSYDKGWCQHDTVCSRERHPAHCHLPWNGRRLLWKSIVSTRCPRIDCFIAYAIWWWCVSWKLNVIRHKLFGISDLFFLMKNQTMQLVCEYLFTLYMHHYIYICIHSCLCAISWRWCVFRKLSISEHTVTWWSMIIDRVWIGYWIYWTLWYSSWIHFTVHYDTHTPMSTVTSSLPFFGSRFFQWRMFPFLWVPKLSPASATSF
jgi:hypothetical protein